jgi:ankyrin repeat protein
MIHAHEDFLSFVDCCIKSIDTHAMLNFDGCSFALSKRLILCPVEDSENEGNEGSYVLKKVPGPNPRQQEVDEDGDDKGDDQIEDDSVDSAVASTSDEGESAAAAHAAAIGNSPQPITHEINCESPNQQASSSPHGDEVVNGVTETTKSKVFAGRNKRAPMKGVKVDQLASKKIRYYCPYNLNERDSDDNTPVHVAILARHIEHVKILLEVGASVHKKSDGSPPVHAAISVGSLSQNAEFAYECVKVLCEHDADLTAKDDALHTPLYLACMYNLPKLVSYLLSTEAGKSTLNVRADRSQGRALHVAAKFNSATNVTTKSVLASVHGRETHVQNVEGTVSNTHHHVPVYPGKQAHRKLPSQEIDFAFFESPLQILLRTDGVEIDAQNSVGQSPLHIGCSRGNWNAVRLLLEAGARPDIADRRGFTPGQTAHKRGLVIPNDLLEMLGGPPSSGIIPPPRDLIVDPDSNTLLITHELCVLHRTCPPIRRDSPGEPPPENVRRLQVLVDRETGILRTGEFSKCHWQGEARRAALVDVLKVRRIQR